MASLLDDVSKMDEDDGSSTVTDAEVSEADSKSLATYEGLAERVTRLEERVKPLASREWVYQKAFVLILAVATVSATIGTALVRAFWG